ncbi:unnamed protein product [Candida verbasci]|uniref:Protein SIP5 n=1 Tax=Candida verbasci TaxID=1227364 RepID=A0A9W4TVB1_9ASCO|nr:unnamed protein product [Candida verbasci]
MGNVPTKETRSRSNSLISEFTTTNTSSSSTKQRRRNTTSSSTTQSNGHQRTNSTDLRKLKRQEEKDRVQQQHYMQLIVKYDENVDGGFLAPYGTYKSNLDYDCDIVRKLIINRELAPFFTPLQDYNTSWTDEEIIILCSQLTLHAPEAGFNEIEEEEDDVDNHKIHKSSNYYKRQEEKAKLKSLVARVKELQMEEEAKFHKMKQIQDKQCFSNDLYLKLYKNPLECPICFLYYPKHLNISNCCFQPICTECFTQVKRLDPHPPHETSNDPQPQQLISQPANCPYCAMTDFGVTYNPPLDIHTGINGIAPMDYKLLSTIAQPSPASTPPPIIYTDYIRPDWNKKLENSRNKLARKAATASAIHASNLIIDNRSSGNAGDYIEQRMIEEAMRLSLIDEEERKRKNSNTK